MNALETSRELHRLSSIETQKQRDLRIAAEERLAKVVNESETLRNRVDELKEARFDLEQRVARYEGYLDRVMEDDHVREPLVATGNEDDQQLVPIRKHRSRGVMMAPQSDGCADEMFATRSATQRKKHWVRY